MYITVTRVIFKFCILYCRRNFVGKYRRKIFNRFISDEISTNIITVDSFRRISDGLMLFRRNSVGSVGKFPLQIRALPHFPHSQFILSSFSLLQFQKKKSWLLKIIIVRGWIKLIWIQTPTCLRKNTQKALENSWGLFNNNRKQLPVC